MTKREKILTGRTYQIATGCGKLYVTVNEHDGKPMELFVRLGKAGGCPAAQLEALGRLSALVLRLGGTTEQIKEEFQGIQCPKGKSCADAISGVL